MERNGKPGETVGRDQDRDLGVAFPYSRRGLRLRRRGAYGIHRASGPRCQGLCRKVASHRENDSLHFVRCSAPSNPLSTAVTDSLDFQVADAPLQIQFA